MRISVLIPTYQRPDDLRRCLAALALQTYLPDEVIVVVRNTDSSTHAMLATTDASVLALRIVDVEVPGGVQALNAGLAHVSGDIVAITDDDAAPHPDWIERITNVFAARIDVGGVGGRDRMHVQDVLQAGSEPLVGKVPLIGKHIGNHHLGFGPARQVDVLKGVNSAYRLQAIKPIGFDERLRGSGAQVHWEISLCLAVKRAGWKLIYDPQIVVDHYLAKRHDEDQRSGFNALAMRNAAYNETLIRLEYLSTFGKFAFMLWAITIGTRVAPGIVQWLRFLPPDAGLATDKLTTTLRGRLEAWNDLAALRSVRNVS